MAVTEIVTDAYIVRIHHSNKTPEEQRKAHEAADRRFAAIVLQAERERKNGKHIRN